MTSPERGKPRTHLNPKLRMAKGSKKGACSSNTQSAKANCLAHDRRSGKVPSYVNPHLSHTNRIVFEDEMIRGRKSIVPLVHQAEKLYTEKTGQKVQASFAAFRESCLTLREGITDEQLLKFKAEAERLTSWKCIGIYLHQDEGHVHSKYIEGDEAFAINYHAHVLWDCQDHQTGKSIKCKRAHLSQMQDLLAAATGMERGNKASETGIRHRSSQQQRIDAQEKRIEELLRVTAEKDAAIDLIREELSKLSTAKAVKEAAIAKIGEYADKARAAGSQALEASKGAAQWVADMFGFTEEAKTIKTQAEEIERLKAEAEQSRAYTKEAIKKGIEDARKADRQREMGNYRALYIAATGKGYTVGDEGQDPDQALAAIRKLRADLETERKYSQSLRDSLRQAKEQNKTRGLTR